jgi:hypothetical protein
MLADRLLKYVQAMCSRPRANLISNIFGNMIIESELDALNKFGSQLSLLQINSLVVRLVGDEFLSFGLTLSSSSITRSIFLFLIRCLFDSSL